MPKIIDYNENPIELLEQYLGELRLMWDDWNRLGWQFSTLPQTDRRVLTLVNYTESKAEGGARVLRGDNQLEGEDNWIGALTVVVAEGSGPHGVPWWIDILPEEEGQSKIVKTHEEIADLAEEIRKAVREEAHCDYWLPPVVNDRYRNHHTWITRAAVPPYTIQKMPLILEKEFLTAKELKRNQRAESVGRNKPVPLTIEEEEQVLDEAQQLWNLFGV